MEDAFSSQALPSLRSPWTFSFIEGPGEDGECDSPSTLT